MTTNNADVAAQSRLNLTSSSAARRLSRACRVRLEIGSTGAHRETDQSDLSVSPYAAPDVRTFFSGRSELLILWLPCTNLWATAEIGWVLANWVT
jgi:hypothetical protein